MTLPSPGLIAERRPTFLGETAIAGVGYTKFSKKSGTSVMSLAIEACRGALADCGLEPRDVDGIVSYSLYNDSVAGQAVANGLGIPKLSYALDLNLGGQAPCFSVANAAMAVASGVANNVLVFRALNGRSAVRIGSTRYPSPSAQFRYPIGFTAYPQYVGMWVQRYLVETGHSPADLADVVLTQRRYAAMNERAMVTAPLDREQYLASPFLVDPFRFVDCTVEADGACAVLVTSKDRAQGMRWRPAVIEGAAWSTGPRPGTDIADILAWPDYSRNCTAALADDLWASSGFRPSDMDFAELYDCFSGVVYMALEGLGLVERGAAPEFVRAGETWLDGSLPVNTHGGLLCEGYLHGMNTLAEAVLQIQGRAGERQAPRHDTCVVTSGALMDGSALVLSGA
jgi:acetyl-CoA acetyltransferase